ncbi:hypothetical protein HDE_04250 [Halotydeus destructor]|nr:hypothetical protein HDE_04250 [Halotydeus destructor]
MSKRTCDSETERQPKRRMPDLNMITSEVEKLISLWAEDLEEKQQSDRVSQTLQFLEKFKQVLEPIDSTDMRRFGLRLFGKETTFDAERFIQRVKERLGLRGGGIAVKEWQPLGSTSVLILFRDEASMMSMKHLIESYLADICTLQDLKRPTVLVTGLPALNTRAVLQSILGKAEILFIKKPNRWNQCSAAIMLDRNEKSRLLREGRIYDRAFAFADEFKVLLDFIYFYDTHGHILSHCILTRRPGHLVAASDFVQVLSGTNIPATRAFDSFYDLKLGQTACLKLSCFEPFPSTTPLACKLNNDGAVIQLSQPSCRHLYESSSCPDLRWTNNTCKLSSSAMKALALNPRAMFPRNQLNIPQLDWDNDADRPRHSKPYCQRYRLEYNSTLRQCEVSALHAFKSIVVGQDAIAAFHRFTKGKLNTPLAAYHARSTKNHWCPFSTTPTHLNEASWRLNAGSTKLPQDAVLLKLSKLKPPSRSKRDLDPISETLAGEVVETILSNLSKRLGKALMQSKVPKLPPSTSNRFIERTLVHAMRSLPSKLTSNLSSVLVKTVPRGLSAAFTIFGIMDFAASLTNYSEESAYLSEEQLTVLVGASKDQHDENDIWTVRSDRFNLESFFDILKSDFNTTENLIYQSFIAESMFQLQLLYLTEIV